jgi:pullulanase/glycogen debranching enzyme
VSWATLEGPPYPLGVSWSEADRAYNFAVYSKHATTVRLLLFDDCELTVPRHDIQLRPLVNKSGRVWHCRVPKLVSRGRYYAYVVDGPEHAGPFELHAFHPEKLLLDPYAVHRISRRLRSLGGARQCGQFRPGPARDDRRVRSRGAKTGVRRTKRIR